MANEINFQPLYSDGESMIQAAIIESIETMKDRITNLEPYNVEDINSDYILNTINAYGIIESLVKPTLTSIADRAGEEAVEFIKENSDIKDISFDLLDSVLSQEIQSNYDRLIITAMYNSKNAMDITIRDANNQDFNIKDTLDLIAKELFLTKRYKIALNNYIEALNNKLTEALDVRTGETVITEEDEISDGRIDFLATSYIDRSVDDRIDLIAEMGSVSTANIATEVAFMGAVGAGLAADSVKRFWVHSNDAKVRDSHVAIPHMNKNGVGIQQSFITPLGPLMYPGDPNGLLTNIIHCRCHLEYKIRR